MDLVVHPRDVKTLHEDVRCTPSPIHYIAARSSYWVLDIAGPFCFVPRSRNPRHRIADLEDTISRLLGVFVRGSHIREAVSIHVLIDEATKQKIFEREYKKTVRC